MTETKFYEGKIHHVGRLPRLPTEKEMRLLEMWVTGYCHPFTRTLWGTLLAWLRNTP